MLASSKFNLQQQFGKLKQVENHEEQKRNVLSVIADHTHIQIITSKA
jgi:hypothetical protein